LLRCFATGNDGFQEDRIIVFHKAHQICYRLKFGKSQFELAPIKGEFACMARKILYWLTTALIFVSSILAGFTYLSGSQQAVAGFVHIGYPQQLRILLGIAKPLGGITLLMPGFPKLKEWAYAGFTFAWIAASVAHYLAKDGAVAFLPIVMLILLCVSYFTRPANRQWGANPATA
jgi:uncharacterized membrane protein YphA (DoxX/SURF4 family)